MFLNERMRRLVAATEARTLGWGGVTAVAAATGVSRRAIAIGLTELDSPTTGLIQRIRKEGAGRKKTVATDANLQTDLESLVELLTRGDPDSPLRRTCKSLRVLSAELNPMGHQTSHRLVAQLLKQRGYSLQANQKTLEGTSQHPDRNAQFEYIQAQSVTWQSARQPVISVDTKKKELVGDFKNGGRELRPKGDP